MLVELYCTAVVVLWQCCLDFFAVLLGLFFIAVGIRNGLIECGLEQAKAVYGDGTELHVAVGLEWLMGGYGLLTGCGRMESTWR